MSRLSDLLRQARKTDPQLGADLEAEFVALRRQRTFGLVFEPHQPEAVELPGRPVRRGDKVGVLPPRAAPIDDEEGLVEDKRLWRVVQIDRSTSEPLAHLAEIDTEEPEVKEVPLENLVVVAEFRDHIYPGLVETGRVERGGDKPFHTVINSENYHALEMLTYTHRRSIDAIYIDPPYNSGARDWKYNNAYVAEEDSYRHSKWLAFMERRLKLSRELLKPDGSLVVTIDEHEVNRLGVLLDQVFPEYTRQMVTIVNNPKGVTQGYLSRVEEYAFYVFGPDAKLGPVDDDLLTHRDTEDIEGELQRPRWKGLLRSGAESLRGDRPDMYYPVWFDKATGRLSHAGDPLPAGEEPSFDEHEGLTPIWPIRKDMQQGRWGVGPALLNSLIHEGYARLGKYDRKRNTWGVTYLSKQVRDDLAAGLLQVHNVDEATGVADVVYVDTAARKVRTVWHRSTHDAGAHGTDLIGNMLGTGRTFDFPKALYAVEDALRPLVGHKPDAVVLDFFAGSGTTAHAVMRLNKQDGGRRQSISVTNNEVSAEEQADLRAKGLRPGDTEWEALGICDFITKPRITAAITGLTQRNEPIPGKYATGAQFPISEGLSENAVFFTLTYEAMRTVQHNRAFSRIAPMLWLRAGSRGRLIESLPEQGWDVSERYAILRKLDTADGFINAVKEADAVSLAFVITDDDSSFQMVCRELPSTVTPIRLYESYLQNFEINTGGR